MKFTSHVIHGRKHGRTVGFPTANLEINSALESALPKEGIYAARVYLDDKEYPGALFYGHSSLFRNYKLTCEVLILDFAGDLYGQEIVVEVIKFLRPTAVLKDNEELKQLIEADIKKIRSII